MKPAKMRVHVEHVAKTTEGGMIDFFRAPLVGASVTLDGLSGITDENGTVTFEVPARPYTVSVSAQNFLPDSQSISVRLGEEVDVYFVLNRDIPNPKEEGSFLWSALEKVGGFLFGTAVNFVELAWDEWEILWFTWEGKLLIAATGEAMFEATVELAERIR